MRDVPPTKRRRRGRWALGCLFLLLAPVVIPPLLLWFGMPLPGFLRAALASATGGVLHVDEARLAPSLSIKGVSLTPPGEQEPLLSVDALSVDYALFPADGRHLAHVLLQKPSLKLNVTEGSEPNYDFLMPGDTTEAVDTQAPWTWPALDWIPVQTDVEQSTLQFQSERGQAVVGLSASLHLPSWNSMDAQLSSQRVAWRLPGEGEWSEATGQLQIDAARHDDHLSFKADSDLTGLRMNLQGGVDYTPARISGDFQAEVIRLDAWIQTVAKLAPIPLNFTSVSVHDVAAQGNWTAENGVLLETFAAEAEIAGLQAGSRATTSWSIGNAEAGQAPLDVTASLKVTGAEKAYAITGQANANDLADLAVEGKITQTPDGVDLDLKLPTLNVAGGALAIAPPGLLPAGAGFDTVRLKDFQVTGSLTSKSMALSALRGELAVTGLALGDGTLPESASPLQDLLQSGPKLSFDFGQLEAREDHVAVDANVRLGDAMHLTARTRADRVNAVWRIDGALKDVQLAGSTWPRLLAAYAPVPIDFASVQIQEAALQGSLPEVDAARLGATVTQLRIGPAKAPWYHGDPQLSLEGAMHLMVPEGKARLDLGPDQYLALEGRAGLAGGKLQATLATGSRTHWTALVPPAYRSYLEYAPAVESASGDFTIEANAGGWRVAGTLKPTLHDATPALVRIDAKTTAPTEAPASPWLTPLPDSGDAAIAITLGTMEGTIKADLTAGNAVQLEQHFTGVDPNLLLKTWLKNDALSDLSAVGSVDGTVNLVPGNPLHFDLDSAWTAPRYGDYVLATDAPLKAHLKGAVTADYQHLAPTALNLELDAANHAALTLDTLNLATLQGKGHLQGDLDLALFSKIMAAMDYEPEPGRVVFDIGFEGNPGKAMIQPTIQIFSPRMREAGLPGSLPLVVSAENFSIAPETLEMTADKLGVSVEDKLDLKVASIAAQPQASNGPAFSTGPFTLDAQALPFASLLFDDCVARANIQGTEFRYVDGQPGGAFRISLRMDSATLSGGLAKLEGVSVDAALTFVTPEKPDGPLGAWTLSGAGAVRIDSMTSGGMMVTDVIGLLTVDPNKARIDVTGGQFYGGLATGVIDVDLTRATFPLAVKLQLDAVNLSQFSQEYKPPGVFMTGMAYGHIGVKMDMYGILDLSGDLRSEDDFSLNRDLVQKLLMYDQLEGTMGVRFVGRALERVLGDAPQRHFDRASVDAQYNAGWLTLDTQLHDEDVHTLNLDITTEVDPLNLYRFLSEQQEAALAGLDSLDRSL